MKNPGKFVSESLGDILKPKSKEEIAVDLKDADPYGLYGTLMLPGNPYPIEAQPLVFQIWNDFKDRFPESVTEQLKGENLGSFGTSVQFSAELNGRSIWVTTMPKNIVMFKIYPFKKIRDRELKKIISANNYMLENMDQYHKVIQHLK